MVVPAGDYRFGFVGKGRKYAAEYHADKATVALADTVAVGADKPGLDAQLDLIQVQNNPNVRPTVNGIPRVGDTLQATSGAWLPQADQGSAYEFTYAWFRSGSAQPIGTGPTLVVPLPAQGETITVQVTASLTGHTSNTATSVPTAPIAAPPSTLANTAPPTITGMLEVGRTVTAGPGTWAKTPSAVSHQWYADARAIPGATNATLAITPDLVGTRLSVTVIAIAPGTLAGYSAATAPTAVARGTLTVATAPTLTGKAKVGRRVKLLLGQTLPASAAIEVQWLVRGKPVTGATKKVLRLQGGQGRQGPGPGHLHRTRLRPARRPDRGAPRPVTPAGRPSDFAKPPPAGTPGR